MGDEAEAEGEQSRALTRCGRGGGSQGSERLGGETEKDPEREGTRNRLNCLEMTLVWNIFHY